MSLTVWTPIFEKVERTRNSLTIKINQSGNSVVGWLCHKQRRRTKGAGQLGPHLGMCSIPWLSRPLCGRLSHLDHVRQNAQHFKILRGVYPRNAGLP